MPFFEDVSSHYVILQAMTEIALARQVEGHLRDGWVCQGGATTVAVGLNKVGDDRGWIAELIWLQTMTKPFVSVSEDAVTRFVKRAVVAAPVA